MKKYIYILILLSAAAAFLLPFQFLLNFAHDDSFFYIKTANNLSKGYGSSFDGISLTNGYHPLYFMLLAIIYSIPNLIFNTTPEFIYRLTFLLHALILISSFYFLNQSLKIALKEKYSGLMPAMLIAMLSGLVFIRDFGLESHLACLIASAMLYLKAKEISGVKEKVFDKSILLALFFMVRTDYLYSIIPLVLIADFITCKEKKIYGYTVFSVMSVIILIYYTINYFVFGYFETVSGKLLNSFPKIPFTANINDLLADPAKLYNQFARIIFVFAAVMSFLFYFKTQKKEEKEYRFLLYLLSFGLGCILFTIFHLMFNTYGIREWYMTLPVFIASVFIALIAGKRKPASYAVLLLSAAVFVYVFWGSRLNNYKYVTGYEYAKAVEKATYYDDLIYQVDYCGVTGFFSNRNIINGDGLINGFEYSEYLKSGKIDEYLKKYDVKYYSTYSSKEILKDTLYTDDNFSDKISGKVFTFGKSSLVLQMPFRWNHIAFDMEGKWYLFKLY